MTFRGDRPIALVTGAARRVGRAVALELARWGFDLLVTCRTRPAEARETCRLAEQASRVGGVGEGFAAEAIEVDLNDLGAVEAVIQQLNDARQTPRLDAVVHNASSFSRAPLGRITADDALSHYRVNALAPLLLTQGVAGRLSASDRPGGGAVVAFGDIHAMGRPQKHYAAYAMSKAALTQLVQSLALDLAPEVRVNGVAPGVVAWPDDTTQAEKERYEQRIALKRAGTPEDAAIAARWLITEAPYLTGEIIRVDGGRWLR